MKIHKAVWLVALLVMCFAVMSLVVVAQENTITVGFRGDPGSLDVASTNPTNNVWFQYYQVYERLVRADKEAPSKQVGVLATSWEASESAKIWTFHLREGVEFQDGSAFTADAVKYSFDRVMSIGLGPATWFSQRIDKIEVVDDYTVKFILRNSYLPFPGLLAVMDGSYIVSPTAVKAHATNDDPWAREWLKDHMVGTGPYMLQEWVHAQYLILVKNPNYWGGWEGKHFDKIVFKIVREVSSRKMGLITGDLDYAEDISYTDIADLEKNPDVNVHVYPTTQLWIIHVNTQRPPLDDVRLRRALSWAFPYKKAIDYIFLGYAEQAQGGLGRGMAYHTDDLPMYTTNLDKAKELLEEAGYKPGEITLDIYWISGVDYERMLAEAFQSNLAQIGVKLEVKSAPWPTVVQLTSGDPAKRPYMSIRYNAPDYADPFSQTLRPIYACGEAWNWGAYCNPLYDELLAKAESSTDPIESAELASVLQWMAFHDAADIFIAEGTGVCGTRSDIKGFYTIPYYTQIAYIYDMYRE